jgi:hypothetical protein
VCVTWHALISAMVLRVKDGAPPDAREIEKLVRAGCPAGDLRAAFRDAGIDAKTRDAIDAIVASLTAGP